MTMKSTFPKGAIGCPTGPMAWACLPSQVLGFVIIASLNRAKAGPWPLRIAMAILAFAAFAVAVPLRLVVGTIVILPLLICERLLDYIAFRIARETASELDEHELNIPAFIKKELSQQERPISRAGRKDNAKIRSGQPVQSGMQASSRSKGLLDSPKHSGRHQRHAV